MATIRLPSPPPLDDRTSLTGSLDDFSNEGEQRSPVFGLPSQHSGFRSSDESEEEQEVGEAASDNSAWSPPMSTWRQPTSAGGWYRHQPYTQNPTHLKASKSGSGSRSRESSPQYESAVEDEEDTTMAAKIPLPKGSMSPVRESPVGEGSRAASAAPDGNEAFEEAKEKEDAVAGAQGPDNYIRFALRAEVQQRTEPIDAAISWLHRYWHRTSKSWTSLSSTMMMLVLAMTTVRLLTSTPTLPPVPDLVKVAGLARSFEPLIFYSENGVRQIGDLQETGVAVWDLGESVRSANMTSAPLIVSELDGLSESLKGLSIELTKFFANVDGDIDGILIVMDWAKRELSALDNYPSSSLSRAFANVHSLLSFVGLLENRSTGLQTPIGELFTALFGSTRSQRTHQTLHRTFNEFLGVLEESINAELTYSTALFAMFENIDRQFLNLQRTVIRESDTQERLETEFLSSLWSRIAGPNRGTLRKYEKNKNLLASVRLKTTQNKSLLVEHNGKLVALKGNLETLRRKLMSPLVSKVDGARLSVEEQVRGLEGTYEHLRRVREKQKGRVLEVLYGAGGRRNSLGREDGAGIDA
ncbi:MAG: hypothetical protein Q9163_001562 [Psora crenata]